MSSDSTAPPAKRARIEGNTTSNCFDGPSSASKNSVSDFHQKTQTWVIFWNTLKGAYSRFGTGESVVKFKWNILLQFGVHGVIAAQFQSLNWLMPCHCRPQCLWYHQHCNRLCFRQMLRISVVFLGLLMRHILCIFDVLKQKFTPFKFVLCVELSLRVYSPSKILLCTACQCSCPLCFGRNLLQFYTLD